MTQDRDRNEARRTAAQECAAIEADLERLKTLFSDAASRLSESFHAVAQLEDKLERGAEDRERVASALGAAVVALQFQDMATQLTGHAQRRLLALQEILHTHAPAQEGPTLPAAQPVRQSAMSAGSMELF